MVSQRRLFFLQNKSCWFLKISQEQILTFSYLYTLLKQVEACLNSRPLLPLNDDISDLEILSPFQLIAKTKKPAHVLPEPNHLDSKPPLLIWRKVQYFLQQWWNRWLHEYLQSLQTRNKWNFAQNNLNIGDIVLIFDNNHPPAKWPFAKIYIFASTFAHGMTV